MDDYIVDGGTVDIVTLQTSSASIPDLDRAIFGAGDHPLALTVKGDTSDVVGVTLEGHHGIGVGGLDVEELDIVVTCSGEKALVGGDTQTVHLGVRVLNGARADA